MSIHPLVSPADLLRTALHHYRAHIQYLITLFTVPFVLTTLAFLSSLGFSRPTLALVSGLLGLGASITALSASIGLISALAAGTLGESIVTTFRRSYPLLIPFIILACVNLFISLGSFSLLIIPGLILSILLSQTVFTFIIDGKRGFTALLASWQLVRGFFWQVVVRLAILWVITALTVGIVMLVLSLFGLGPAPTVSPTEVFEFARAYATTRTLPTMIIFAGLKLFILTPFAILFLFELYQSLKAHTVHLPQLTAESLKKRRMILVACGVIGLIALLIFFIFSLVLFNYAIQALELSGGPHRDFVQILTELRSLSPQHIQAIFTRP